jgi:O-antigen ligase
METTLLTSRAGFGQIMGQLCIISALCISVLAPPIVLSDAYPKIEVEQALLPLILLVYGILLLTGAVKLIRLNGMFVVGVMYFLCTIISMWYGSDILHHTLILRDYYELPKAWLPVIFFTMAYEADLTETSLRRVLTFMAVSFILVCLYAWGQFLELGFTYKLNILYSGGEHIDLGLENARRAYSTMGNPNILGQLMSWGLIAYTMAFLYGVGSRIRNLGIAFMCLVTVVLSGSRYGLLTSVLGFALILAMTTSTRRRRAAQLGFLILLLPIFAWTFAAVEVKNQSAVERFGQLKRPADINSLRERLDDLWLDAGDSFSKSPVVGHGPAKVVFTDVHTDSEYLNVLKQYGVVGFLPYMAYYLFPVYLFWKGLRADKRTGHFLEEHLPATYWSWRFGFVMIVMLLVMNIGEFVFYNDKLQAFWWIWLGICARSARTITSVSEGIQFVGRSTI